MRSLRRPCSVLVPLVILLAFACAASAAVVTVGHPLINRPSHDGVSGAIFLVGEESAAGTVTDVGFYDNNFAGRQMTPVILKSEGTGFRMTGIGTTRTSTAGGSQVNSFGLVSGSDQLGLGSVLGWKDGSNGSDNAGTPEYTNSGPGEVAYLGGGKTSFAVGDTFGLAAGFARTYSFEGTVSSTENESVGNMLRNRGANDGVSGAIFLLDDPFTRGGQLTSWAMFDDDNTTPNRSITPLLLAPSGAQWEILGIGTAQLSAESGAQYFDFGLVSGTNTVGAGVYFGWKDGTNGSNNAGVADYDGIGGGPGVIYLGGGKTSFAVGDTFGVAGTFDRTYSIQALTVVPEPATLLIWSLLAGLGVGLGWRRRR